MKTETIILKLEQGLIEEVIKALKQDLKDESSYKTNSRIKTQAIKRVCKNPARPTLEKYNIDDNKIIFTNTYVIFKLDINTVMPIEQATEEDKYPNTKFIFEYELSDFDKIDLDVNDIMYNYKLKQEFYSLNGQLFNIKHLKDMLDIMGNITEVYLKDYRLVVKNDKNEECLALGIKNY